MSELIERYHAAVARMDTLIEATPTPDDSSLDAVRERASYRMGRLREFLARLGDPHEGFPIVHVGGTSGKGSTSTTIAAILTAAGYRTGLHTSPYVQTPLEKIQINGDLCDVQMFIDLVDEFWSHHDTWIADGHGSLTYGEAWNALMWMFFRKERVDIAVIEVGSGGRFDVTNILTPALTIITSVGIDHTATLGDTIEQIAWHKAGIIKPGAPALSAVPNATARAIIADEAEMVGTSLLQLDLAHDIDQIAVGPDGTSWREVATGEIHTMRMCGSFQARNGQTAVAAARLLDQHGIAVSDDAIRDGLLAARIPGRAELVPGDPHVMLDGAHNPEKIGAMVRDLDILLPRPQGGRRIGVFGLLDAKKGDEIMREIVGKIDVLVATSPQVFAKEPKAVETVQTLAAAEGFRGEVYADADPLGALEQALRVADPEKDVVLVTGSLYLVGNIRERWYPEAEIVSQRSPWPEL